MELSGKLKEERQKFHFTQESLAEELGVSSKTIQSWEAGKTVPSLKQCSELSDLYGVSMDYLLKSDIASKNEIEEYIKLGRDVRAVVNYVTYDDFISQYGAAEKESELLIPRIEVDKFFKEVSVLQSKNSSKANLTIKKLCHNFVYKWYKFNKANMQFTEKNSKKSSLVAMGKFFTDKFSEHRLNESLYPEKPVMYLRDELINQIRRIEDLDDYPNRVEDPEEAKYMIEGMEYISENNGEIMYPTSYYK